MFRNLQVYCLKVETADQDIRMYCCVAKDDATNHGESDVGSSEGDEEHQECAVQDFDYGASDIFSTSAAAANC
ncbi:hypothetical protein QQ045_017185 [Rhodiola kirilowii]